MTQRPVEYPFSHRREIIISETVLDSPRNNHETLHCNLMAGVAFNLPQLGFRIRLLKLMGGETYDVTIVYFFCYFPTLVMTALAGKHFPPIVCAQKRRLSDTARRVEHRHLIRGIRTEFLKNRKLTLIFIPLQDVKLSVPRSCQTFADFVGRSLPCESSGAKNPWSTAVLTGYFEKIWSQVAGNALLNDFFEQIDSKFKIAKPDPRKLYLICDDNCLAKADLKALKRFSPYFDAVKADRFGNLDRGRVRAFCESRVLKIIYEFVYTARLHPSTCVRLHSNVELLIETVKATDYFLMESLRTYLNFIIAWKVLAGQADSYELIRLHPLITDPAITAICEAFIVARQDRLEIDRSSPDLRERIRYLTCDNFFTFKFTTDNNLCWCPH